MTARFHGDSLIITFAFTLQYFLFTESNTSLNGVSKILKDLNIPNIKFPIHLGA